MASNIREIKTFDLGNGRSVSIGREWSSQQGAESFGAAWMYAFRDEVTDEQIAQVNEQIVLLNEEYAEEQKKKGRSVIKQVAVKTVLLREHFYDLQERIAKVREDADTGGFGSAWQTKNHPENKVRSQLWWKGVAFDYVGNWALAERLADELVR